MAASNPTAGSSSTRPPQRPTRKILIANRGEIALRLLQACRDLAFSTNRPLVTYTLSSPNDTTHVTLGRPDHAISIPSAASHMDIDYLVSVVRQHKIDAIHPGYGFLSESAEFSRRMWQEAHCMVVGPGWDVLERTGHKLAAKGLAANCGVPILKAMEHATGKVEDVISFVERNGGLMPIMVKAVDGGGGRGIRLARTKEELKSAAERCIGESPSGMVFAEQAAADGFKHIEVQILGDGQGGARHLWERDCSVQRRFQKIVEVAPTPTQDRTVISQVIGSAMRMAQRIQYLGLGTFEFLVNLETREFFFLEANPRLQVEHTITESISGVDLVQEQLLIAQNLVSDTLPSSTPSDIQPPPRFSIQLRLCAEDPNTNFALSIGKVTEIRLPSGNGIRVDSHLSQGGVVGSDFDNLMAKIIVTASTWQGTVGKAQRALSDTSIVGVKTNLNLLRAILEDESFKSGSADTQWLEKNTQRLVQRGNQLGQIESQKSQVLPSLPKTSNQSSITPSAAGSSSTPLLRKGDTWSLTLTPTTLQSSTITSSSSPQQHQIRLTKIFRNQFPETLVAEINHTAPSSSTSPTPYTFALTSSSPSTTTTSSSTRHKRGSPSNPLQILTPLSGKLIDLLVEPGDVVRVDQVVAYIRQMKMELEVRSQRGGRVKWVIGFDDDEGAGGEGEDVSEGTVLVELEDESGGTGVKSHL